jgi:hypothetical protein
MDKTLQSFRRGRSLGLTISGALVAAGLAVIPAAATYASSGSAALPDPAHTVSVPDAVSAPITGPGPIQIAMRNGPDGTNFDDLGYTQTEYFVSGTAGPDHEPYTVRMIVRAPANPSDSSGVVVYEPTHRGGNDLICQFARLGIGQRGHICVGVTARAINLTNPRTPGAGLKDFNADRYESLRVTDDQTNDVLAQIAWMLKSGNALSPLAGVYPVSRIVMAGTSDASGAVRSYMGQAHNSAFRAPGGGPVIDGFYVTSTLGNAPVERVDVPTIQLPTQYEVTNSVAWRRPDGNTPGDQFRAYEVAGMAHNESRDQAYSFTGCEGPLSQFPYGALTFMGLQHLIDWTYGIVPPPGQRLKTPGDGGPIALDDQGNALGGVRTAYLDVPATSITVPNAGPGLCYQTGSEKPLTNEQLRARYTSVDDYVSAFEARLAELTAQGWWPAEYTDRYGVADAHRLGAYVRAAIDEAPDGQAIAVTIPEGAGRFTWNIDGSNGLVDLGTASDEGDHWLASGSINPIRVSDTRSVGHEWSVSAQVSEFTSDGSRVEGKFLGWAPKVSGNSGGALPGSTVASGFDGGSGLADPALLGSAPDGHTPGAVLLGADLELKLPSDVDPGTYSARLTLTALS